MNQFTAPGYCDVSHHRNHFEPSVRAALGLLDRCAEGQDVSERDVQLALQVTGDANAGIGLHEIARIAEMRGKRPGNWREGPSAPREPHPRAQGWRA